MIPIGPWPAFVLAVRRAFVQAAIRTVQRSMERDMRETLLERFWRVLRGRPEPPTPLTLCIIAVQWDAGKARALINAIFDGIGT